MQPRVMDFGLTADPGEINFPDRYLLMTAQTNLIFSCLRRPLALLCGINQPSAHKQWAQLATFLVATPDRHLLAPSTRPRPD